MLLIASGAALIRSEDCVHSRDVQAAAEALCQHLGLRYGHLHLVYDAGRLVQVRPAKKVRGGEIPPAGDPHLSPEDFSRVACDIAQYFRLETGTITCAICDWRFREFIIESVLGPSGVTTRTA